MDVFHIPFGKALKIASSRALLDPISSSAISERDRREREEGAAQYMPSQAVLVDHMERSGNMKNSCYRALLCK